MAGMPRKWACSAAPMVPEMKTSLPMLAPLLMPETTRSTGSSMMVCSATMALSAGVPSTA